jgi:hypothetical protein
VRYPTPQTPDIPIRIFMLAYVRRPGGTQEQAPVSRRRGLPLFTCGFVGSAQRPRRPDLTGATISMLFCERGSRHRQLRPGARQHAARVAWNGAWQELPIHVLAAMVIVLRSRRVNRIWRANEMRAYQAFLRFPAGRGVRAFTPDSFRSLN